MKRMLFVFTALCLGAGLHTTSVASETKEKSEKTSLLQPILVGGLAGMGEVLSLGQVCTATKNLVNAQAKTGNRFSFMDLARQVEKNPKVLFKGLSANLVSMVPTTALQVGGFEAILPLIAHNKNAPTEVEKVFAAGLAGSVSGLVSGPTEGYLQNKQTTNRTVLTMRGLPITMLRDGNFTVAYLAALNQTKKYLVSQGASDTQATVTATLLVGTATTVATHPLDTIRDRQQGDLNKTKYTNAFTTMREVMKEPLKDKNGKETGQTKGFKGLYSGVLSRGTRINAALFTLPWMKDKLTHKVQQRNAEKNNR